MCREVNNCEYRKANVDIAVDNLWQYSGRGGHAFRHFAHSAAWISGRDVQVCATCFFVRDILIVVCLQLTWSSVDTVLEQLLTVTIEQVTGQCAQFRGPVKSVYWLTYGLRDSGFVSRQGRLFYFSKTPWIFLRPTQAPLMGTWAFFFGIM